MFLVVLVACEVEGAGDGVPPAPECVLELTAAECPYPGTACDRCTVLNPQMSSGEEVWFRCEDGWQSYPRQYPELEIDPWVYSVEELEEELACHCAHHDDLCHRPVD